MKSWGGVQQVTHVASSTQCRNGTGSQRRQRRAGDRQCHYNEAESNNEPRHFEDLQCGDRARDVLLRPAEVCAMTDPKPGELYDPQKGLPEPDKTGQGEVALGNQAEVPTTSEGDSPNRGSVEGPLAPQPLPGGAQNDASDAAGAESSTRIETDAERHQRQAD